MGEFVVVGVDGSVDSVAAARWAAEYARGGDAVLRVVHVWTPMPWYDGLSEPARQRMAADRARSVQGAMARVADALAGLDLPPGRVRIEALEGAPGAALVALSREALGLAVGATGTGNPGATPEQVGATARYVTRHAICPVTVLSGRRRRLAVPPPHRHAIPVQGRIRLLTVPEHV